MVRPSRWIGLALATGLLLGVVADVAIAKKPTLLPEAEYRGKDTELQITPTADHVVVLSLPLYHECKGPTPTNLGDYGPNGLLLEIKGNGSFTNDGSELVITGRFRGKRVTGTVKAAAFKDPAKGFDCSKFSGSFSAKLVKGTGLRPGQVLARDDFGDENSGFGADGFNFAQSFGGYLEDGRYRMGLRGAAWASVLRDEPGNAALVEVEAQTLTFGGEPTDGVGVVCHAFDASTFLTGYVRQDGVAQVALYSGGEEEDRSEEKQLPDGVVRTGQGAENTVRLVCRPTGGQDTEVELWVNGKRAVSRTFNYRRPGKTGLFVTGGGNGTDYNFTSYVVRTPRS